MELKSLQKILNLENGTENSSENVKSRKQNWNFSIKLKIKKTKL